MFALEVEDVDGEGTLIKVSSKVVLIVVQHGTNSAVIVVPDHCRKRCFGGKEAHPKSLIIVFNEHP